MDIPVKSSTKIGQGRYFRERSRQNSFSGSLSVFQPDDLPVVPFLPGGKDLLKKGQPVGDEIFFLLMQEQKPDRLTPEKGKEKISHPVIKERLLLMSNF